LKLDPSLTSSNSKLFKTSNGKNRGSKTEISGSKIANLVKKSKKSRKVGKVTSTRGLFRKHLDSKLTGAGYQNFAPTLAKNKTTKKPFKKLKKSQNAVKKLRPKKPKKSKPKKRESSVKRLLRKTHNYQSSDEENEPKTPENKSKIAKNDKNSILNQEQVKSNIWIPGSFGKIFKTDPEEQHLFINTFFNEI
jgi:hypothetical protein